MRYIQIVLDREKRLEMDGIILAGDLLWYFRWEGGGGSDKVNMTCYVSIHQVGYNKIIDKQNNYGT